MSEEKQEDPPKKGHSMGERIMWILAAIFIVGSIAAMFAGDYYYAPGNDNPHVVKDAVDD